MFDDEMLLEGSFEVDYLVVAGGGGGGATPHSAIARNGGHGGAGDALPGALHLSSGSYPVVVGVGGPGGTALSSGSTGGDSTAFGVTAKGGGGGGAWTLNGLSGGSGGGGGSAADGGGGPTTGGAAVGQGFPGAGGAGSNPGAGGGAGGAAVTTTAGPGIANSITGASVIYSRGGDNSSTALNPGRGGNGGRYDAPVGGGFGAPGLDGVVIIRYLGPPRATGGAITASGEYTLHTFTSNGTFTAL